jgi:acyl transferase domain-containing protein
MTPGSEIAVIGMAGRFPGARDVEQLDANLRQGRVSLGPISRERIQGTALPPTARYRVMGYLDDVDRFDHAFFDVALGEARTLSPFARLLMEEAWHAFESSGCSPEQFRGTRTDVYMTPADLSYCDFADELSATLFTGNSPDFIVGRLNRQFDLRGQSIVVDTSCASGLSAMLMACDALSLERAEYALVCGATLHLWPFDRADLLATSSADGRSRSYAADASGMAFGEAAVCVLLTPLARARARRHAIHAVVRGGASNSNGAISTSPSAPNSVMQARVMVEAWTRAGITPEQLGAIEGHGSGTLLGDGLEIEAFHLAFGDRASIDRPCALSSIKANVGHGTAGALSSVVKAVLSVQRGVRFPAPGSSPVNPALRKEGAAVAVHTELMPWPDEQRVAAVHAVGMSGVNAHLVVENWREEPTSDSSAASNDWFPMPVSARTSEALHAQVTALRHWLTTHRSPLEGIARTLSLGRQPFACRTILFARDVEHVAKAWDAWLAEPDGHAVVARPDVPRVVLLLSADAQRDAGAARAAEALSARFPRFRRTFEPLAARQLGQAAQGAAFQLALHDLLAAMGISGTLVCSGAGKPIAAAIRGEINEDEAVRQAAAIDDEPLPDLEARAAALVANQSRQGPVLFIQMGRDSLVSRAIRQVPARSARVVALGDDAVASLADIVTHLFRRGYPCEFSPWFEERAAMPAILPGYVFARTRCWLRDAPKPVALAPALAAAARPGAGARRPDDAAESLVEVGARIWRSVLQIDRLGEDDDFLQVGGHSLLASEILARTSRELGIELSLDEFFSSPTVRGFAGLLRARRSGRQEPAASLAQTRNGGAEPPPLTVAAWASTLQRRET